MGHNSLKNYLAFIWNWNWTGHHVFYRTILAPSPESESGSLSVSVDSLRPCGLHHARILCPWNSPDTNTGVGSHSLLQEIFLTQGLNPGLLHCRWILYCLSVYLHNVFCYHKQFQYYGWCSPSNHPGPYAEHFFFILASAQQLFTSSEKWIIAVSLSVLYAASQN